MKARASERVLRLARQIAKLGYTAADEAAEVELVYVVAELGRKGRVARADFGEAVLEELERLLEGEVSR